MAWCEDHPTVHAAGVCPQCTKGWCTTCSRRSTIPKPICPRCGALLGAAPAGGSSEIVSRVFSSESLIMAVGLGVLGLALQYVPFGIGLMPLAVRLVYLSLIVTYYFQIIQHVGFGGEGMPAPTGMLEDLGAMFGRAFRGIGCVLMGLVPLFVYHFALHRTIETTTTLYELLVIGQLYMPAILLAVTVGDSGWNALWPPSWLQIIARAPGPYFGFSVMWLLTVFAGGALVGFLQAELIENVPYAGVIVSASLSLLYCWFQAILVGRFLRKNAEAFGWD